MKLPRLLAATGCAAVIGASVLAFAAPAYADDVSAPAAPFPAETSPYAAGWFTGGGSVGASSNDALYGLDITAGPLATDSYQVLNGTPVEGDLTDLMLEASMYVTRGAATFQVPVFGEPGAADQQFTTLRPAAATVPGSPFFPEDEAWITSRQLGAFAAGSTATLAEFEAALDGGAVAGYDILAFGAVVSNGQTASISQIGFAGDTHLFRAAPTRNYPPILPTPAQFTDPGITAVVSGLVPNEPVVIWASSDNASVSENGVADADGKFTYTFAASAEFPARPSYVTFEIFGAYSGFLLDFDFLIAEATAVSPATPSAAAPQLAATGVDLTGGSVAAGLLLLIGAALGTTAIRRRSAASA